MNYLDLFAGIGGFALGAYNAGWRFDKHYFSEVDDYAIKVYRQRFPGAIPIGDITKISTIELVVDAERRGRGETRNGEGMAGVYREGQNNTGKIEKPGSWIVTGGFPCQDISVAGKGAGIGGSRSGLWFEMWRIIRDLRPRYVIAENVAALTFRGLDAVLNSLAEIGYDAEWTDIRASDMGAPHRRERIWIVAYPNGGGLSKQEVCEEQQERAEIVVASQDVADTQASRLQKPTATKSQPRASRTGLECCDIPGRESAENWTTEPDVGRVVNGVPARVDRLKALGNSIVPQIAELLFRRIDEAQKVHNHPV